MMKDLFDISGRIAVVTGANSGIGSAAAELLASKGANVALIGRREPDDPAIVELLGNVEEHKTLCKYYQCSVSTESDVVATAQRIKKDFGRVDILFNNAAAAKLMFLEEMTEEQWDLTVDTSLKGTFLCCREFGKIMIEQKRGAIVNMASIAGVLGLPRGTAHHSAAKAGVMGFTRAAAVEWAKHGIRVNTIVPGQIGTSSLQKVFETNEKFKQDILNDIPLGRVGLPEEIAHSVLFLVSDAAGFITGQTLIADGGTVIK
ncbi:MAG: SDR family oxidoreductase [Eubacteriales bacterium]|nr:SDR family oxidoreductase [Eubacteriales bacterium]